jgi:hypothetical protein
MSWLSVPKTFDDSSPRSSNGSTSGSSDTPKTGQDSSVFGDENGSYSDDYDDDTSDEESLSAIYEKSKRAAKVSVPSESEIAALDEKPSESGDLVTPRSAGREEDVKKKVKYGGIHEKKEKPSEKVYDNISQYFMGYHTNLMTAWYETTLNRLINKQEYAVEAVKLEWLLKKRQPPNLGYLRKSKEERLEMKEVERELELLQQNATNAEKEIDEGVEDDEDITNTLSDISDEIMDGKRKGKHRERKHNPQRDARRVYHLMNAHSRKVF